RTGCAGGVGVDVRHPLLAQIDCRQPRLREARAAWSAYGGIGPHGYRRPAPQIWGGMTTIRLPAVLTIPNARTKDSNRTASHALLPPQHQTDAHGSTPAQSSRKPR